MSPHDVVVTGLNEPVRQVVHPYHLNVVQEEVLPSLGIYSSQPERLIILVVVGSYVSVELLESQNLTLPVLLFQVPPVGLFQTIIVSGSFYKDISPIPEP